MIRAAQIDDLKIIEALEVQVFGHSLGYAFLKSELLNNEFSHMFVYEMDNHVMGYIGFRMIDGKAEILNFLIGPAYQRRGIGRILLESMLDYVVKHDGKTIVLEVRSSNMAAQKLYQDYGFKYILKRENYYQNEDAYVFMLEV